MSLFEWVFGALWLIWCVMAVVNAFQFFSAVERLFKNVQDIHDKLFPKEPTDAG